MTCAPVVSIPVSNGLKILVADDFESMRRIVQHALNSVGFHDVTLVGDGSAALALLQNGSFDCLITDALLPQLDGLELLRAVRADPRLHSLRVLMLSAEAQRAQIIEAMQAGVDGYLVKPFTAATLKARIERVMAGSGSQPASRGV
ncbi:MAG: response regulator [Pseudomonadales bacterium]|jgi:two-component system chemotaxis response regulator CheY|nr:response regulator [Pseudomonadales bacterium]MBP6227937.1 response regulator [Pseudomonadales bacterium]